jgi:hypothetical protein
MISNQEPEVVVVTGAAGGTGRSRRTTLRQAWRAVAVVCSTPDRS